MLHPTATLVCVEKIVDIRISIGTIATVILSFCYKDTYSFENVIYAHQCNKCFHTSLGAPFTLQEEKI